MCLFSCLVCVASLALILYVANTYAGQMFETLVRAGGAPDVVLKDVKINLKVGFFLLIPYQLCIFAADYTKTQSRPAFRNLNNRLLSWNYGTRGRV